MSYVCSYDGNRSPACYASKKSFYFFFQDIKSCNLLIYSTIYNLASTAINLTISRPARKMIMSLITTIDDETLTWDTSVTYKNNKGEIYTRTHIYKKQYKFIEVRSTREKVQ